MKFESKTTNVSTKSKFLKFSKYTTLFKFTKKYV